MSELFQQHIRNLALCGIFVSLQASGCANTKPQQAQGTERAQATVQCSEPRPQFCTQEYLPVCATLRDGTERTLPNSCSACSDTNVIIYRLGECG